jgi:hypothetical protein
MYKMYVVGLFFLLVLVLSSVVSATTYTVTSDISGRVYVNEVYSFEDSLSARLYVIPSVVPLFNTTQRFFGGSVKVNPVYPPTNGTSIYTAGTNTVTVSWDDSNNSDSTVVVRNNNSIPVSAGDGTILYNGSAETYDVVVAAGDSFYLSLFGYNDTANQFSTGVHVSWGAVGITAYDVNTGVDLSGYSVFISNQDGTQTYADSGVSNPYSIGFEDIPTGDKCIIKITASGYNERTQYHDLYVDSFYNLSFYLSDVSPPGAGDCSLLSFFDTYSVSNPAVDVTINLTYDLESLIGVELYNTSLYSTYGGWIALSNSYFSYNTTHVVVNNSILDSNSSMVRVNYHYEYCVGDVESLLYTITVADVTNSPILDAYVEIQQYLSFVGSYVTISSLYTDGSGTVDVYLSPDVTYKIFVSKDGYDESISDWTTTEEVRNKLFILQYTEVTPPSPDTVFDCVAINHYVSLDVLYVTFDNVCSAVTIDNISFYLYEIYNDSSTLFYNSSCVSGCDSVVFNVGVNSSREYIGKVFFNSSEWDMQKVVFTVNKDIEGATTGDSIDRTIGLVFGFTAFGWQNLIMWFIIVIGLLFADDKHQGWVLMLLGLLTIFLNVVVGFNSMLGVLVGGALPVLFIVIGFLVEWNNKKKEVT